ncbi:mucin 2 precursor [Geminocystis sp. NIES-3708]|uniref:GldG family protein n=1 Tax=Geminocystis sp. NIES-3708 TaxID=1615909 RepID=UPI0005FCB6D4|nr:Gldg family protein [Geminocystis sp. NIES-3708]BAQ60783.1 mucin 2 precursor [Geminocystis sp. NIES-3708]
MKKFTLIVKIKKYLNYLFFLGIFLISVGIVLLQVTDNLSNIIIAIISSGIIVIICGISLFLYTNKSFWGKRGIEAGTNAIISTSALLLILALVNFLALKYSVKIDFTENNLYTLSPQSQQLVTNLSQPLKVYIFSTLPNDFDRKLLQDYSRKNNKFQYQFVDPQVDINLAQKFQVTRLGDVYLEYADKQQLVQTLSSDNRLSEIKLTNAIAKIQQTTQPIIYILQGHGESPIEEGQVSLSQAVKTLRDKGYMINSLTLATSPLIPPDANVVIISNPEQKLLEGEIKIIEKYLDNGGSLLIMSNAGNNVNLDQIIKEWGIKFDDRLVVDASGTGEVFGLGPSITIIVDYGTHPITQNFGNGMSLFPWARPIITETVADVTATPFLITNNQSWGERNPEGENVELDPTTDLPGPLNIGVALAKKNILNKSLNLQGDGLDSKNDLSVKNNVEAPIKQESMNENKIDENLPQPPTIKTPLEEKNNNQTISKSQPSESRIVVIGNANFATDGWFQQQLNSDLFINTVGWLANEENSTLSISPKEPSNRRINLSTFQGGLIGWLALFIIPGLAFTASIVTWWQRSR